MSDRMSRFVVFDGGEVAPASHRFCGRFYAPTKDPRSGAVRPGWEPLVFHGPSEAALRDQAFRFVAAEEQKVLDEERRAAERAAKRANRLEASP